MHDPDIRLLKEAYAIVNGIPDAAVSLAKWRTSEGKSLTEGTVCCPAGWLTLNPTFQAKGLTFDRGGRPAFGLYRGYAALAALFRIETEEALEIFRPLKAWSPMSDKAVWLDRVLTFLVKNQHKPAE
jgi:hypothetical protein